MRRRTRGFARLAPRRTPRGAGLYRRIDLTQLGDEELRCARQRTLARAEDAVARPKPRRLEGHGREPACADVALDDRQRREPDRIAGNDRELRHGEIIDPERRQEIAGCAIGSQLRLRAGEVHGNPLWNPRRGQGKLEYVRERGRSTGHEGMSRSNEEMECVLGHRIDRKLSRMPLRARCVGDADLELAGDDCARQLLEVRHDHACAQTRVRRDHATERHAERQLRDEHVGTQIDHGRLQSGELLEIAGKVACLREDPSGVLQHKLARLSGHERTRRAAEKVRTQRRLDRAKPLTEQVRREAKRARGTGNVTGGQHREQVEQAG